MDRYRNSRQSSSLISNGCPYGFANSKALELAGIDKNTPEVPNGTILRDSEGNPTGILKSNAMNLLLDKIPPMTANQKEKAIVAANNYFLAQGITSVHDVKSGSFQEVFLLMYLIN